MQAKWGSHGDYQVITLSPWSVQEMYDQAIEAFNLSEQYRVPVFLMAEEAVGHLRERMDVRPKVKVVSRLKKKGAAPFGTPEDDGVPPMPSFGEGEKLLVTGSTHNDMGIRKTDDGKAHEKLVVRINNKILKHRQSIIQNEAYQCEDAEVVVAAYGFTARSALLATQDLRKEGKKVGLLRLKTIWPFADQTFREVGKKARKIYVPEMNRGQIAGEIMKYAECDVVSYCQTDGEIIHPHQIVDEVRSLL
jgi:2-oxoglutarate ferredoxin oxidoreductase subunit alpha